MSKIVSRETIEWVLSGTKDEDEIGGLRKVCRSHEALRQAECRGWSASERHSRMWQTAVRQGEMLTTENRCLRERAEQAETERTRATMYLYNNHKDIYRELEEHISGLED